MSHNQQLTNRHLTWEGCYNVRDLGGLPTVDGKKTRWQAIIRSDILSRLTPQGKQALLDYGVQTIIDLRSPKETKKQPSVFTKITDNANEPRYLNLPIEKYYPHVGTLIKQATTRAEVYCIVLDYYADAVADIMRAIANAQPGGVIIHCHAGKDRTGTIVGLLLSLVGVPPEIIAADYAESQVRLWPLYEKLVAKAGGEDKVGFWLKPTVTPEMMHHTLAHIDEKYGSVEIYLTTAGLSPTDIKRLKNRL